MIERLDPAIIAAIGRDDDLAPFSESARQAGRQYAAAGRVVSVKVQPNGWLVLAKTQGSARLPYAQTLQFIRRGKAIELVGHCTCPVAMNCKHVAAALTVIERELAPGARGAGAAAAQRPAARIEQAPAPAAARLAEPAQAHLPYPLAQWIEALGAAAGAVDATRSRNQHLRYVLGIVPMEGLRGLRALRAMAVTCTVRKDGKLSGQRPFNLRGVDRAGGYATTPDRLLLRRLARLEFQAAGLGADDDPPGLLRQILATGRAHWKHAEGVAVAEAAPRPGSLRWVVDPDAALVAQIALDPPLPCLSLGGVWYVDDTAQGPALLGPIETGLPGAVALRMLSAPPIPPEHAELVTRQLASRKLAVPPPVPLEPAEFVHGPPVPRLRLTTVSLPFHPGAPAARGGIYRLSVNVELPAARLSFGYGPVTLAASAMPLPQTVARDGRLYRVMRDRDAERQAMLRLDAVGLIDAAALMPAYLGRAVPGDYIIDVENPDIDWFDIATSGIAALRAEGWEIEVAADFPVRVVAPDADSAIEARITAGSGIDWFDLDLGVMVEGRRVDLVPLLLRMIGEAKGASLVAHHDDDEPFLIPLDDGRLLTLPMARIRPIIEALADFHAGEASGALRVSRQDAAGLEALARVSGLEWQGGEQLRALGRLLSAPLAAPALPPAFQGVLRPYQAEGVAWLQRLRATAFGGILADDMGLGKTVQTLAHLAIEHAEGRLDRPALILCPTSLVPNWIREAARFAPHLKLLTLHGLERKALFDRIPESDLVLTTYPLLARDHDILTGQEWHIAILDEAQIIKNPKAETTRAALGIKARQRICLSGTPFQNHLGELWSLFDYLAPGFLGSEKTFRGRYRTPIEKHGDADRQSALQRRLRPFLLRRTKAEVATDLPPRTDILEPVVMEAPQRALYEGIRIAMHAKVQGAIAERGIGRSGIIILDALLKLRQACCDPRLVKFASARKGAVGSAKLERLMELLATLLDEGRRILVFSQFTSMLALIGERLDAAKLSHVTLTGDTKDRATPVNRFQNGEVPIFLVSLKAGGVGLNLTAADTVIHYDPWWNPAAEDQATDRAHRIGQTKPVFVHRLMTTGSIEEKIETLKSRKRGLVASILDSEQGGALSLTEADIAALFAPA